MDPADEGERLRWYDEELTGSITLPGSMAENNLGDDLTTSTAWTGHIQNKDWYTQPSYKEYAQPGNFKFPFWLSPRKHYVGAAWYQREIEVPGRFARLSLERPHWRTSVWLDDKYIGTCDSVSTPHEYDMTLLKPGKHRLTIRVDNRLQAAVGVNAHSVTDHTQTNWNGIVGRLELAVVPLSEITSIEVFPEPESNRVRVRTLITNHTRAQTSATLELNCSEGIASTGSLLGTSGEMVTLEATTTSVESVIELTKPVQRWDEFAPNLYTVRGALRIAETASEQTATFGFRDFKTSGTQFAVNGRPAFLRGTLECCIFPMTGYPPTDVEAWRRILRVCRAHGLNHVRFHSWCPPQAAFVAADELGIYYSVEVASWTTVGEDPKYEEWLYAEAERIVREYGNHPSFCMLLYGNEPHGPKQKEFLARWNNYWKPRDARRLYSGGAGWPIIQEDEFHITPTPRIARGKAIHSRINEKPPETHTDYRAFIRKHPAPVVSHEIGQWCVYPNLAERAKYTGVLHALNFDIFADSLANHHMLDQAHDFLMASGKAQALCYKEEIESALHTPGMGGFQLLDLHDFPGQGTALVGVLDPFWDEKGYISAAEYRRFSGETVPLARLMKRVWTTDETLTASLEVTHFGPGAIEDASTTWSLRDAAGREVGSGKLPVRDIPLGSATSLGKITVPLSSVRAPAKLVLELGVAADAPVSNSWDLWVYPADPPSSAPADVLITRVLDDKAHATLIEGGKALLIPESTAIQPGALGQVAAGFSTTFWNTAWFPQQEPVTLGMLCDPKHPALSQFPTEFHTNWQWWYILNGTKCMLMDGLPPEVRPIVQMIDDWTSNRRLGLIFEAQFMRGKLLVCSADLEKDLSSDPVRRQLRKSLLNYMQSDKFAPKHVITPEQLRTVLKY